MILTITNTNDLHRALEGWGPPASCQELVIDCPQARRFTNCLLGSDIDCRVRITPTTEPAVSYAGLFSGCRKLNQQPQMDTSRCINMAAMFKGCESMRSSHHWLKTSNVRDMRQMFMGCTVWAGNGPQYFDYTALTSEDAMRNFATGTKARTVYYDQWIDNLYKQAKARTLPTPMNAVAFGAAQYSPVMAEKREFLVNYGWEIIDGGEVPITLSPFEVAFSDAVDNRLESGTFPGTIDLSPVCRTMRGGIAITPRHTLHCRHYMPPVGQPIKLWNGEEARVQAIDHGEWDIAIATLDRDCNVTPAMVLPRNWQELLPNAAGPPCSYPAGTRPAVLVFNRNNRIGIWDLSFVSRTRPNGQPQRSAQDDRAAHHLAVESGDSGSPACFVLGDRLVVGWSVVSSDGSGVWLAGVRDWADAVVARTGHSLVTLQP
jgi:hypothetical protein